MLFFFMSLVTHDLWFYFSHILMHKTWLYKYHSQHHNHSDEVMTWRDTYHAHWIETPLQGLGAFLPGAFLSFRKLEWSYLELGSAILYLNVRGCIQHEPRLSWLFGKHHIQHHDFQLSNYGQPWVDWIAGTEFHYQQGKQQQENPQLHKGERPGNGNGDSHGTISRPPTHSTTVIPWTIPALFFCVAIGSAYV